jgi:hypothetical protein
VRLDFDHGDLGTIVLTVHDNGRRDVTHED